VAVRGSNDELQYLDFKIVLKGFPRPLDPVSLRRGVDDLVELVELVELVDRPIQIDPPPGHFDIRLIDEPSLTGACRAAGREVREILEDFPDLEPADILAALEYAAAAIQERELPLTAR
jgi:hypothetical protein